MNHRVRGRCLMLNPYAEWLGLDSELTQPNFFELLQLDPATVTAEAARAAADRAIVRVRSFRPGPHAQAWAALLDELKEAKSVLGDPERLDEYRRTGRSEQPTGVSSGNSAPENFPKPSELPSETTRPSKKSSTGSVPLAQPTLPAASGPESEILPPGTAARPNADPNAAGSNVPLATPAKKFATPAEGIDPMAPVAIPRAAKAGAPHAGAAVATSQTVVDAVGTSTRPATSAGPATGFPSAHSTATPPSVHAMRTRRGGSAVNGRWLLVGLSGGLLVVFVLLFAQMNRSEPGAKTEDGKRLAADSNSESAASREDATNPAIRSGSLQRERSQPRRRTEAPTSDNALGSAANEKASASLTAATAESLDENEMQSDKTGEPKRVPTPAPGTADSLASNEQEPPEPATSADTFTAEASSPTEPSTSFRRADVITFGERLAAVQELLLKRQVAEAQRALEEALTLDIRPEDREMGQRLARVVELLSEFWDEVAASVATLEGGQELKFNETTYISIVEVQPERLVYRVAGQNRRHAPRELPAGLAKFLVEMQPTADLARRQLRFGALYAIEGLEKPRLLERAREFWQEAALNGAEVTSLQDYLDDEYDLTREFLEQVAVPSEGERKAAEERVKEQWGERMQGRRQAAERVALAEELVVAAAKAEAPAERYMLFDEARKWAARGDDVERVLEITDLMLAWFEFDDELQQRADAVQEMLSGTRPDAAVAKVAESSLELCEAAFLARREALAEELATVAVQAARRSGDRELQRQVRQRLEELAAINNESNGSRSTSGG